MIVIDASAALEILLQTPAAIAVEARLFQAGQTLHAPHLIDLEVAQVLRRYAATNQIAQQRCHAALDDWLLFPVSRHAHAVLLPRVWDLRANITAYDAVYVALAEALDVPLITRDGRLAGAPGHTAKIELI
ncbi:MAG: type II toxin-antitoxin system VapC family toxin [Alphaproteobacteria bacterium]|nr:type II toxin-antitoxin system VapC family toxin [Alphaproteobacteria bacterium]